MDKIIKDVLDIFNFLTSSCLCLASMNGQSKLFSIQLYIKLAIISIAQNFIVHINRKSTKIASFILGHLPFLSKMDFSIVINIIHHFTKNVNIWIYI